MSLLIFTSIAARLLSSSGDRPEAGKWGSVAAIVPLLLVAIAVVYIRQANGAPFRQYARRMIGRRQYSGTTTYIH